MRRVAMWRRYARLLGPDPRSDVAEELDFHLESKTDDLIESGWAPKDARREAERQLGDLRMLREIGEQSGIQMERRKRRHELFDEFRQDVRYALRTFARERSFTLIMVIVLALGITANTGVFSVVNTLLLRPLPFPDAGQLVWLASGRNTQPELRETAGLSLVTYTVAVFEELRRHSHSFLALASYNPFLGNSDYTMTGRGEPQPVAGVMVDGNFFQTLGVTPALGRLFLPEESRKGGRPAVILAHAFWRQHFGEDQKIIGQVIRLAGTPATVVGVLPPSFDFGSVFAPGVRIDLYVPAYMEDLRTWGNTLALVGRLRPGVSVQQAQAELDILMPQLVAAHREWYGDYSTIVSSLKEHVSGSLRRPLILLWCAVGVILLIVCVNLSNLLLAQATTRSREFAMRTALGAGRGRLFRQLLTESLLLSSFGVILGLAGAFTLTAWLARQGSIALPLLSSIRVDGMALGWTLLVGAGITVLFGLLPGLGMWSRSVHGTLKETGTSLSAARGHERLRGLLVVSEVGLACVLLISAGLLLRSFLNVLDVDLGFQPSQAAVIRIDYDAADGARRAVVLQDILRGIAAIPGVEAAGVADMLPLGRNRSWGLKAQDKQYPRLADVEALVRIVTPGYLRAMGMRLSDGRDFSWADSLRREPVVIINEAAARRHFPGQNPVGRYAMTTGNGKWQPTLVVGVISDVREHTVEAVVNPEMYLPIWQAGPEGAELVVRSKLPPETLAGPVMKTLRSLSPIQPQAPLRPLQEIVDRAVSPRRFFVLLVTSFASLGLVLASLGIFGVISYSVTRQRQEIGVRMALGAGRGQVVRDVMSHALRLALVGAVAGVVVSLGVARSMSSLLFNMQPTDPSTFVGMVALLALVAVLAGYIPARRAAGVEPMVALRTQ